MWSNSHTVGGRVAAERIDRLALKRLASQVGTLRIPLRQSLPFEVAADAPGERLGQLGKLGTGRCLPLTEARRAIPELDIYPVEEQPV